MDFILNPFVSLLTFLYSIFNRDMVIAIVVFTVIVRLLTFPLTQQQLRSSQAMQKVQPEMKRLQEKYKNDREKLAQEQMALYRQYGVNPLGGCLPLLIQFPIFIALYQAIIHALGNTPIQLMDLSGRLLIPGLDQVIPMNNMWLGLDLTQAPNISAPFPTMLVAIALPLLTMITTWVQFKVTQPAPQPSEDGKPNQAQQMAQSMGTIMPIMYGFFALSFSIGISIYFIVSNLAGIAQYALMGRADFGALIGRPKPIEAAAMVTGKASVPPSRTNGVGNAPSKVKSGTAGGRMAAPPPPKTANGARKPATKISKAK